VTQPQEIKEYHYYVGHIEHSAMLTEKMAQRLNAKPIDEPLDAPGVGEVENNEAQRASTGMRDADDSGVNSEVGDDAQRKSRSARNKRAAS